MLIVDRLSWDMSQLLTGFNNLPHLERGFVPRLASFGPCSVWSYTEPLDGYDVSRFELILHCLTLRASDRYTDAHS